MTDAEQAQIIGEVLQELKAEKQLLACLEEKSEKVARGLEEVVGVLRGEDLNFDYPNGRLRVAFSPVYPSEQEIIEIIENTEACKQRIAKLQMRRDSFGLD